MRGGVVTIRRQLCSERKDVREFLVQLNSILSSSDFNIDSDIVIQRKKLKDDVLSPYTTENTLLELDYDLKDIVEELKKITIAEYHETIIDRSESTGNLIKFYVFGHEINRRTVYIKVRIKHGQTREYVFCISFHFAEYPIARFPYA